MLIGDQSIFAIESGITHAYERLSLRALGFFVIHIEGRCYGVCSPDATMLACSFDEVEDRIARRGHHTAPFASESNAGTIADAFLNAIYAPDQESECFFNLSQPEFHSLVSSNHVEWAPDGDEAFDDGSHIVQFEIEDRVRLVAFKTSEKGYRHDPGTLSDIWLEADEFYQVLQSWHDAFEAEWSAKPKISDDNAQ